MPQKVQKKTEAQPNTLVLLIPGLDGTGKLFKRQTAHFKRHHIASKIVNLHGASSQTIQSHAAQVMGMMERHPDTAIHLFGESYGACVVLEVLASAPKNLASAALLNPLTAIRRTPVATLLPQIVKRLPALIWAPLSPAMMLLSNTVKHVAREDIPVFIGVSAKIPRDMFAARLKSAIDYRPDYRKLRQNKVPVLLLASGNDRMMPSSLECGDQQKMIANSRMCILNDLDHQCLLDRRFDLSEHLIPYLSVAASDKRSSIRTRPTAKATRKKTSAAPKLPTAKTRKSKTSAKSGPTKRKTDSPATAAKKPSKKRGRVAAAAKAPRSRTKSKTQNKATKR
jgi:pimeloyl-ACP methyl ester carboxylesterase